MEHKYYFRLGEWISLTTEFKINRDELSLKISNKNENYHQTKDHELILNNGDNESNALNVNTTLISEIKMIAKSSTFGSNASIDEIGDVFTHKHDSIHTCSTSIDSDHESLRSFDEVHEDLKFETINSFDSDITIFNAEYLSD